MNVKEVFLNDDEPFITLGTMLKMVGLIQTGGMAKHFLQNNVVFVNDVEDNRRGRKLYRDDKVRIGNATFLIK